MNESDFFDNISVKLGRDTKQMKSPVRTQVGAPDFWQAFELPHQERIERFCESLAQLGGHVDVCTTVEGLAEALRRLLEELNPHRIATWSIAEFSGTGLPVDNLMAILEPYETVIWGEKPIDAVTQAEVGFTGCIYAVADTGTLVMMSNSGRGRSVSLLPSVHIAVVRASQIKTRLGEVLSELSMMEQVPSSVHFISGPSRSSDIENDHSIGVHGPAAVYVLVYDDLH